MNSKRSGTKQAAIWARAIVACALLVLIGALLAPLGTQTATGIEPNPGTHVYFREPVHDRMNSTAQSGIGSSTTMTTYMPLVVECKTPRLKVLLPLYIYPDHDAWPAVAAANSRVPITAIINPKSGPGSCPPDDNYKKGLELLRDAGVTLLGYASTGWATRSIDDVKDDVTLYNQCFNIGGIFFDQAASAADKCGYYQEACGDAEDLPNLYTTFLNPGVWPDECYFGQTGCDTVVIFEEDGSQWPTWPSPSYADDYSPEHFAMIAHTVPDTYTMRSMIDLAVGRDIRYVYVTDKPYDHLPTYGQDEIDYIASINDYHVSVLCGYRPYPSYESDFLSVTQTKSEIHVKNKFGSPLAIRVSWDHRDPYGIGEGEDSHIDPSVDPDELVMRPIKNHASVQCWAWDASGRWVDSCDLLCFR